MFVGVEEIDESGLLGAPAERAVDTDRAGVRCEDPGADVHERGFAGTVFSDERHGLSPLDGQIRSA